MRQPVETCNAQIGEFDLLACLNRARVTARSRVYLNWHRFDRVDELDLETVAKNFDYFYYPSADDMDVFDDSLTWILSVDPYGYVFVASLVTEIKTARSRDQG